MRNKSATIRRDKLSSHAWIGFSQASFFRRTKKRRKGGGHLLFLFQIHFEEHLKRVLSKFLSYVVQINM